MRDINRIDTFTNKLNEVWKTNFSDWRFGQFMSNFFGWACDKYGDMFFWEEEDTLKYLDEYVTDLIVNKGIV